MTIRRRSADELFEKLRRNHWHLREWRAFQAQFGDDALFEVLLSAFAPDRNPNGDSDEDGVQLHAAHLLEELRPRCPHRLEDGSIRLENEARLVPGVG
jgi:hypothetical protein